MIETVVISAGCYPFYMNQIFPRVDILVPGKVVLKSRRLKTITLYSESGILGENHGLGKIDFENLP